MKRAKPNEGPGGVIYADSDGGWYYIVNILEDGNEKRVLSSNALFHIQDAAERFSMKIPGFNNDVLIIDGKTHKAIAFYEQGKGLKKDWKEQDSRKAKEREKAYKEGKSLIVLNF